MRIVTCKTLETGLAIAKYLGDRSAGSWTPPASFWVVVTLEVKFEVHPDGKSALRKRDVTEAKAWAAQWVKAQK